MTKYVKKLGVVAAVLLTGVLLAACSSLIPDQPATDPFALDGESVPVTFAASAATLAPQAVTGEAGATFNFPDFDTVPPVSPKQIDNLIGVASATLQDAAGPETITLSNAVIELRAWQSAASYEEATEANRASATLQSDSAVVLNRGTCDATSCAYTVSEDSSTFGTLVLSGGGLGNFLNISTSGPTSNSGSVSLTVQGEPDSLAGSTLTVTLDAASGTLKF